MKNILSRIFLVGFPSFHTFLQSSQHVPVSVFPHISPVITACPSFCLSTHFSSHHSMSQFLSFHTFLQPSQHVPVSVLPHISPVITACPLDFFQTLTLLKLPTEL
ncbi:hypothetical protein BsWGS_26689 [Bradybaena similaris]